MKPIPKSYLIHTATISTPQLNTQSPWGDTGDSVTTLSFVRVDPCVKYTQTKERNQVQVSAVLFYDCKNSIPKNQTFCEGQKINWKGLERVITSVDYLYDKKRLHHLEVNLS